MNRRRLIWVGVWLVLFIFTSAIVFGGGRDHAMGRWHGWGHNQGWGHMQNWGSEYPWRDHHFWLDDEEDEDSWPEWSGMMDGYGWGHMHGFGMQRFGNWLQPDLSSEQRSKVRQLIDATSADHEKLLQQRIDAHEKLQKLYASDKRDWAAIRTTVSELMSVQTKLLVAAVEMQQKIDALLSEGQRKEISRNWRRFGSDWN